MGLGDDFGFAWTPHGTYAKEIPFFVDYVCFTLLEALKCASKTGAEIMGCADEIGMLEEDKLADQLSAKIEIRNLSFRVVGVLKEKGGSAVGGENQDETVLVPVTSALESLTPRRNINMVVASAAEVDRMEQATAQVRAIVRPNHGITLPAKDDFEVRNQAEIVAFADQALGALTAFLGAIAGVSLVVGGIGIMNIMLVSVTERTREIGIRLAVEARGSDVLLQFLVESVLLCVVGGLFGACLTFGFAAIANRATEYTVSVGWDVVLLAIAFSAAIGVFFGLYPARKAAQLDPIEALRYE